MTVEACPDIEAVVERLKARADAWSLNEDGARLGVRLGDLRAILSERKALREALGRIERWFGEFPETGDKWEDGSPVSYATLHGSNGERDYMRGIARQALKGDADVSR